MSRVPTCTSTMCYLSPIMMNHQQGLPPTIWLNHKHATWTRPLAQCQCQVRFNYMNASLMYPSTTHTSCTSTVYGTIPESSLMPSTDGHQHVSAIPVSWKEMQSSTQLLLPHRCQLTIMKWLVLKAPSPLS